MFSHVSTQAWRTHRGRCISISWYNATRTGKGIRAVEVPADVLPHHHASRSGKKTGPKNEPDTCSPTFTVRLVPRVQLVFWVRLVLVCFNSCKLGFNSKDPAPLLSHPSTFYNENPNTFFPNNSPPSVQTRNSSYTYTPFNLTVTL